MKLASFEASVSPFAQAQVRYLVATWRRNSKHASFRSRL